MGLSVCIQCGAMKSAPYRKCRRCGFNPARDDESLVRSVYLSTDRHDLPESKKAYRVELEKIGALIRSVGRPSFDEGQLEELRAQLWDVRSVPYTAVFGAILHFFLPTIALLLCMYIALLILRA